MNQLNESIVAVSSISKACLTELKSFKKPPEVAKTVMVGFTILFSEDHGGKGEVDYWGQALKILNSQKIVDLFVNFDKDNVSPKKLAKLEKQVFSQDLTEEKVKNVSFAASAIFSWVKSIYDYCMLKNRDNIPEENMEKQEEPVQKKIETEKLPEIKPKMSE